MIPFHCKRVNNGLQPGGGDGLVERVILNAPHLFDTFYAALFFANHAKGSVS